MMDFSMTKQQRQTVQRDDIHVTGIEHVREFLSS